jgi:large subunit ribosomal protein L25
MSELSAEIRAKIKKGTGVLLQTGGVPAVLYGPKIKNLNLKVDLKEFKKVYREAGESSLFTLKVEGQKDKFLVLIHDIQLDPISGEPIHVDFYQPALDEEVEATVPLVFEGEASAVKTLGGTLVKNISEIDVKALPQKLPREIKVNIEKLKTFEDVILVGDLQPPEGVKFSREAEEILVSVSPPEKEELRPKEEKPEEPKEEAKEVSADKAKEKEEKKEEPKKE